MPQVVKGQEVFIKNETDQGEDACQGEGGTPGPGALPPPSPHMLPELQELSQPGVGAYHGKSWLTRLLQVH